MLYQVTVKVTEDGEGDMHRHFMVMEEGADLASSLCFVLEKTDTQFFHELLATVIDFHDSQGLDWADHPATEEVRRAETAFKQAATEYVKAVAKHRAVGK